MSRILEQKKTHDDISRWEDEGGQTTTESTDIYSQNHLPHPEEWDLLDELRDLILERLKRVTPMTDSALPVKVTFELDSRLGRWADSKVRNNYQELLESEVEDILQIDSDRIEKVQIQISRSYQPDGPCSSYWLYYCQVKLFFTKIDQAEKSP